MTFRLAFTGTGYIARIHALAAQTLPDVRLHAVVNHRPESAAKFAAEFGVEHCYTTVAELLAAGGADALVINTPNALHAPEALAALKAGVPVMVEKPMTMNAAEARAMCAVSAAKNVPLMVAHCWRFEPQAQWLRAQVAQGTLGRIIRTKGYGVHVAWGPAGWFNKKQLAGGGALADMGIHAIDTARYLLGDPRPLSVYARIGTYYQQADVDDTGLILVNWEGGATSYIESGWWQPHSDGSCAATQLYGTTGFGQIYPTYAKTLALDPPRQERIESGFPDQEKWDAPQAMYEAQLAHFVDCARTGRTPGPNGELGYENMLIIDAAYESARLGREIVL